MGFKTLKVGTPCFIKSLSQQGTIEEISSGRYKIKDVLGEFFAHDLKTIADRPAPKPPQPIKRSTEKPNQVSDKQKILNAIYSIIAPKFKIQNPDCGANLPGCTRKATEIHHKYKRTGFWLIVSKFFLPICRNCHGIINVDSDMAIENDLSISRMIDLDYEFTEQEKNLIEKFNIRFP